VSLGCWTRPSTTLSLNKHFPHSTTSTIGSLSLFFYSASAAPPAITSATIKTKRPFSPPSLSHERKRERERQRDKRQSRPGRARGRGSREGGGETKRGAVLSPCHGRLARGVFLSLPSCPSSSHCACRASTPLSVSPRLPSLAPGAWRPLCSVLLGLAGPASSCASPVSDHPSGRRRSAPVAVAAVSELKYERVGGIAHGGGRGLVLGCGASADTGGAVPQVRQAPAGAAQSLRLRLRRVRRHAPRSRRFLPCRASCNCSALLLLYFLSLRI
jgi:hypothetical protein